MARFLFCVHGAAGHIHPTLPVAIALKQRGHEVAILTAVKYADTVRNLGLTYMAPCAWSATLDRIKPATPAHSLLEVLSKLQEGEAIVKTIFFNDALLQARDLRETMRDWLPDVLVSSDATFGVSLVAQKEGIPWAVHSVFLTCPLPSGNLQPWGFLAAAPPRTLIQRQIARLLSHFVGLITRSWLHEWKTIRAAEGLPRDDDSWQKNVLLPYLLSPYLYTIPSCTAFDFPRTDLPEQVHYVGPCLWKESNGAVTWENPFKDDKPLIYFTAGTVHNALYFFRTAVAAAAGQEFNLFATLGKNNDPATLGTLPPNVRAESYVPQHLILPHTAAVLCNGGSGATMGTLVAGKPLIVVPQDADQPENARRCLEAGVAEVISPSACMEKTLRAAIVRVLSHNSYRTAAERLSATLSALDGPGNAAQLLEQLAKTKQPVISSPVAFKS